MKRPLMLLLLVVLSLSVLPVFAQSDELVPQSGYWTSTIVANSICRTSENSTSGMPLPIGYQSVIPIAVSDDGSEITIDGFPLTRTGSGEYQSSVVPTDPQTFPPDGQLGQFGRATVASSSSITFDKGSVFSDLIDMNGDLCPFFGTYELSFLSEEAPEEIGPFRQGLWSITAAESTVAAYEHCNAHIASRVTIDDSGFLTYNGYRMVPVSDTEYILTYYWETDDVNGEASAIAESNERFNGRYSDDDEGSASEPCSETFEGSFIREMTLGPDAAQREPLDTSIVPRSGNWLFAFSDTNIEGDCELRFGTDPFVNVLTVSEDGSTITNATGTLWNRSNNGYYISTRGNHVIEAVSPEALSINVEGANGGCAFTRTGTATWQGEFEVESTEQIATNQTASPTNLIPKSGMWELIITSHDGQCEIDNILNRAFPLMSLTVDSSGETLVWVNKGYERNANGNYINEDGEVLEVVSDELFNVSVTTLTQRQDGVVVCTGSGNGTLSFVSAELVTETPEVECTVTAANNVNLRSGPGTTFDVAGQLTAGQSTNAVGRSNPVSGFVWYHLESGAWVRQDVISTTGSCDTLPIEG